MTIKYATAADAIAANPDHPVVIHGEFCKARLGLDGFLSSELRKKSYERRDKINNTILSYFNR